MQGVGPQLTHEVASCPETFLHSIPSYLFLGKGENQGKIRQMRYFAK